MLCAASSVIFLLLLPTTGFAHVRLIYPPARYPALDFISNQHSTSPCGVTKPAKDTSSVWIRSGQPLNVTWFSSAPYHGGYRIELLDETDETIALLTDGTNFVGVNDTSKTSEVLELPEGLECTRCALRLVRQATEHGREFEFYSCADVNIVENIEDGPTCGEHGSRKNGTCVCDEAFADENCYRQVECSVGDECGKHGKCVTFDDRAEVSKQCFCENGYFGHHCGHETKSFTRDPEFDSKLYELREVGPDRDRIYWRIVGDELEVVLKFKSDSWAGIGWRPVNASNSCPALSSLGFSRGKLGAASENTKQIADRIDEEDALRKPLKSSLPIEPIIKNKSSAAGVCGVNEEYTECPEFTRQCEASCDWTRYPETIPNCPRTCGTPKCICKEGFVRVSNENDTCVPFHFCSDEVEVECAANSTWAKCGVACEPTCENMYDTSPCPARCDTPSCTCADNYVRYKGECIFWGDCPNLEEHWAVEQATANETALSTTTEETTPQEAATTSDSRSSRTAEISTNRAAASRDATVDTLTCGINETINACGRACEPNCDTVFSRAPCAACAKPSCACLEGYARMKDKCIFWGDCPSSASSATAKPKHTTTHSPSEAIEDISVIEPQIDEVRSDAVIDSSSKPAFPPIRASAVKSAYPQQSGKQQTQRPAALTSHNLLNSTDKESNVVGDVCYGDWRWPVGCRDCDYRVSWNYLDDTDEIEFSVETRAPSNWWTGIGFSPTGTMMEADFIIVKSRNGQLTLHDMYSTGYGPPREDSEQNVYTPTVVGTHVNGMLRAQFTRKRDTGDRKADHRFSDTTCYKFLFPVSGGRLDANGQLMKHIATPQVSEKKVCIRSCTAPQTIQPTSSCETEFRYPTGCEGAACDYIAKWEYSMSRKDVRFEITAKEVGRWTGIGFSRDGNMANSDIYTGWVYEGKAYVTDRFAYGRQLPAIDPADRQDIYEIGGKIVDDTQTITFRRKVLPADTVTDFPLNKCYYLLFPIGGGRVLARKSQDFQNPKTPIGYHDLYQPRVSRTKICICDQNGVPIASEDAPPAVRSRRQAQDPFDLQVDPFVDTPQITESAVIQVAAATTKNEQPLEYTTEMMNSEETSSDDNTRTSAAPQPQPKSTSPEQQSEPEPEPEEPMECTDIVIGQVKNGHSRVRDYFALSRATPRLDSYYGGDDSVKSAVAYQQDGVTTVVFRKQLKAKDNVDHMIERGPMTVVWAKGEEKDGAEENFEFFTDTVVNDENEQNRGTVTINFFDGYKSQQKISPQSNCSGSYSYPKNCDADKCTYHIDWISDGKVVTFKLKALAGSVNRWTGIGFSLDGSMANSDIIAASVLKDSTVTVIDYFSSGYGRPKIDSDQGIFDVHGVYESGYIYANFSRGLVSEDEYDLSINECIYFLYPVAGGDLEEGSGEIKKHTETPVTSPKKVCLKACGRSEDIAPPKKILTNEASVLEASVFPDESTQAIRAKYEMIIRILNREWNSRLSDGTTEEFRTMTNEVTKAIDSVMQPKWPSIKVAKVTKFVKGSVIAHVTLTTTESNSPSAMKVKQLIEDQAVRGPVESLNIEPSTVKAIKTEIEEPENMTADQLRNWILIGLGVSLFLLAFCLVCCIVCRSCSRKRETFFNGGYPVQYPMNGYGYQATMVPAIEKKGFENATFQSVHTRHFSQATTASQNGKSSPNTIATTHESPKGVGETTYQEWYAKVASKPGAQLYQESTATMPSPQNRSISSQSHQSIVASPYVSYPNEPSNYYTLNGEHRAAPAPPGYYRPY